MILRMLALVALLMTATATTLAQETNPAGASSGVAALPLDGQDTIRRGSHRKTGENRFSFGFLAGASLNPPQGRWGTEYTRFPVTMFPGSGASPVAVQLGTHNVHQFRYQVAAPIAGMFTTARLTERFSLQAGVSWRKTYGTTRFDSFFDQEFFYPGSDEPVYSTSNENDWSDSAWEIPVTVNYRLGKSAWRPFVGAGPTFRLQGWTGDEARLGVNAAFGFDLYSGGRWTVKPQVRFTHWFTDNKPWQRRAGNQLEAVVAVTF